MPKEKSLQQLIAEHKDHLNDLYALERKQQEEIKSQPVYQPEAVYLKVQLIISDFHAGLPHARWPFASDPKTDK
jgi:hypothetical protein